MLEKLRSLWNTAKTTLHYGPSTEPLWTHVVEMLHAFEFCLAALEARIAELEGTVTAMSTPTQPQHETAPTPAPIVEPIIAPTETIHVPDQPAADGAIVSSGDDKAATPSVQPSLEAAGQTQGENHG